MRSPEDRRLREHFANLREGDRRAAPPFGRIAAQGTASPRRGWSQRIVLAAILVLAIAAVSTWRTHRSTDATPRELAAWSSPTAFLLETPGKQFLDRTPTLGEEFIHVMPATHDGSK